MGELVTVFGHGSDQPGDMLNSRESFLRLAQSDVDGVELDVRRTSDDVLIARHDPVLADGRSVRDTHSSTLDASVVLLEEALDICRGLIINIEIKNYSIDPAFDADEHVTDLVIDLLERRDRRDRVIVSSFGPACLDRVRARHGDIPTAALLFYPGEPDELLDPIVASGHQLVHPFEPNVDASFMEAARSRGLVVNAWTVRDSDSRLQRLLELGVDGIITARFEAVRALMR